MVFGEVLMVNSDSRLDNLQKGRGKKKKLGHKSYSIKLSPEAKQTVESIAQSFSCTHGSSGSISALLNKIASEDLMIVETPPTWDISPDDSPVSTPTEPSQPREKEVLPKPSDVIKQTFPKITTQAPASAEGAAADEAQVDEDSGEQSSQERESAPIA
ncbi:MAG: hypothetical protein ACFB0D_14220 [Phormidesmis sp.]